jgi:hypothetical protein
MKLQIPLFLLLVPALFIFSCGKSSSGKTKSNTGGPDVYVSGYSYHSGTYSATYWKNGIATILDNSTNLTEAYGIAVSGTDVYVIGTSQNTTQGYAVYWKNGVKYNLADPSNFSFTNSITIQGSDVYITGTTSSSVIEPNGSQQTIPVVWKNGVASPLTDTTVSIQGGAIAFNGTDMYVAAQIFDLSGTPPQVAELFKNNIHAPISLSDYYDSAIAGISVQNNDIYLAGWGQRSGIDTAVYWENGNIIALPPLPGYTQAEATGIAFLGTDMYIVGYSFTDTNTSPIFTVATLWKNGVPTKLSNGPKASIANAIAIQGNDVYVAGMDGAGAAAYWKNGNLVELSTLGGQAVYATGIMVVPN